jgi:hypothetical protein
MGINEFKMGYQPRTNLVKDKRGDLLADPHKILNRWKNYFCHVLNIYGEGGVRQTEMHRAEPFVPEPSTSEVEVAIGKLKRYKSQGVDQIPAELIVAGGETLHSEIHNLIKLIWNKELPHQWKESVVIPIHKKGDKADCSNYRGISLLSTSYKICQTFFWLGQLCMQSKFLGITNVDFGIIVQRMIKFSVSGSYWRKNGSLMVQYINYSYISRKPMIQLGGKYYTIFSLSLEYPGN